MKLKGITFWEMGVAVIQCEAAGRAEFSPPPSVVLGWDSSALSASRWANKADSSHRFSSQQDALRDSADVKTLLPSSELVSSGMETRFVICVSSFGSPVKRAREWLSNCEHWLMSTGKKRPLAFRSSLLIVLEEAWRERPRCVFSQIYPWKIQLAVDRENVSGWFVWQCETDVANL